MISNIGKLKYTKPSPHRWAEDLEVGKEYNYYEFYNNPKDNYTFITSDNSIGVMDGKVCPDNIIVIVGRNVFDGRDDKHYRIDCFSRV